MIHKNRCNRRYIRRKAINHKLYIIKHIPYVWWCDDTENISPRKRGKLAKGKIHSNRLGKSTIDRGVKTNSYRGYPISERRKLDKLNYQEEWFSA